jgi:hypothetical protein
VRPATDEDLARELDQKIKQNPSDKAKDNQRVVKVSDAVACVENTFNSTTLIKEFVLVAAKSLISGTQTQACGQSMFDAMAKCIRDKALSQLSARDIKRSTSIGRPALGHGKGRKSF